MFWKLDIYLYICKFVFNLNVHVHVYIYIYICFKDITLTCTCIYICRARLMRLGKRMYRRLNQRVVLFVCVLRGPSSSRWDIYIYIDAFIYWRQFTCTHMCISVPWWSIHVFSLFIWLFSTSVVRYHHMYIYMIFYIFPRTHVFIRVLQFVFQLHRDILDL